MSDLLKIVAFSILLFMFTHCGPNSGTETSTCTPNVIDSGLQLYVSALNTNTYQMQLCAAPGSSKVFTVYGAAAAAALADDGSLNTSLSKREPVHISINGGVTGSSFQITFNSTDNYFAIFQDRSFGSGEYVLDSSNILVHAHRLPGR